MLDGNHWGIVYKLVSKMVDPGKLTTRFSYYGTAQVVY